MNNIFKPYIQADKDVDGDSTLRVRISLTADELSHVMAALGEYGDRSNGVVRNLTRSLDKSLELVDAWQELTDDAFKHASNDNEGGEQ